MLKSISRVKVGIGRSITAVTDLLNLQQVTKIPEDLVINVIFVILKPKNLYKVNEIVKDKVEDVDFIIELSKNVRKEIIVVILQIYNSYFLY